MDHTRHMGIFTIPQTFSVSLIGAGGIGALAAVILGKMGVRYLDVYDADRVDDVNIATQFHRHSDVGMFKTHAVKAIVEQFTGTDIEITRFPQMVDALTDVSASLVISAVDSISARKEIWNTVVESRCNFYLDTRMAAEEYQHFLVDMDDEQGVKAYNRLISDISDGDVPDQVCTAKATIYCSAISAGYIGHAVKQIVTGTARSHRLVHNIPNNFLETFPLVLPKNFR
jgi:molybdopterin/thiamine biosynthesis adenylyltransferase